MWVNKTFDSAFTNKESTLQYIFIILYLFVISKAVVFLILLKAQHKPETDGASCEVTVPPCDTGCTESMLGLPNITPKRDPWQLLKVTAVTA